MFEPCRAAGRYVVVSVGLSLLRRLRHLPDRLLHGRRRHAALRAVSDGSVRSVLVLCNGNICRSPYAAAVLAARGNGLRVDSAGFIGPGRPCPPEAIAVARARGVALESHRSRLLDGNALAAADLVLVMDRAQARRVRRGREAVHPILLGDLDPESIDTRTIRDPVECDETVFRQVYDRIDRCVAALGAALRDGGTEGRP